MNIAGLNKAALLAAFYNYAVSDGNARIVDEIIKLEKPSGMSEEDAQKLLDGNPSLRFDWVWGRTCKVDLDRDEMDTYLYNRDNGENAAEKIISAFREAEEMIKNLAK
jgi:hypothetical protein